MCQLMKFTRYIRYTILFLFSFLIICGVCAQTKTIEFKFIETSDVHGNYFPYNYVEQTEAYGSLSRIHTYVNEQRGRYGKNLLLLDNGDILDGQPTAYYYNYIDTLSPHICSDIMNYMKYDVGNFGNHDIETGQSVLDRWIEQCDFPILSANLIRESDKSVYTKPYEIFERENVRIAVLGLTTSAIPAWVCKSLWCGLAFEEFENSARKWINIIRREENPDVIIGLFHSGKDTRMIANKYKDDVSLEVAYRVPGFDVIMMGHDHNPYCGKIVNIEGDSVLLVNPGCDGTAVADVSLSVKLEKGKVIKKNIQGWLTDMNSYKPSMEFMNRYSTQHQIINDFVSEKIGVFTETITTRPAYFGPSAFIDLIHTLQLDISNADISFASPLSFDTSVESGDILIGDMFGLYKYKNLIYTMELSGKEVKNYLEESYALWTNQMKSLDDHLLLFGQEEYDGRMSLANLYYFFDSAAGIIYTVDVTKPKGEKVIIESMSDGSPFDMGKIYSVAMTSYRGNGGGNLLTKGAGLTIGELDSRIKTISQNDFRYYLVEYIKKYKEIHPHMLNQWKFIPEDWVKAATERDYHFLFGNDE